MRIYIANLGKYNEGELVGAWFTPPVDFEEVKERLGVQSEEEIEIEDYELPFPLEGNTRLWEINALCRMVQEMQGTPLYYEMDVVQACISSGSIGVLSRVIHSVEDSSDVVNSSLVKKAGQKLGMARGSYPPRKLSNISKQDNRSLQFYYFAWLYGNKGVIVGRAIGEFLTGKEIPPAFKTVIEAAVSYSKGEIL